MWNLVKIVKKAVARFRRRSKRRSAALIPKENTRKKPTKNAQILPPPPAISVNRALGDFSGVQLSPHTKRAYERDLRGFIDFLRSTDRLADWHLLGPSEIAGYRDFLINERKFAKASVTRKIAVLKSFFSWNVGQGYLQRNPADTVRTFPQSQESSTGFLTEDQVYLLLNYLDGLDVSRLSYQMARVALEALLMLGVRRSEAVQLSFADLKMQGEQWTLRVKGKGGRDRQLPVAPRLLETLEEWFRRLYNDECPQGDLAQNPGGWVDFLNRRASNPILISTKAKNFSSRLSDSELARVVRKHCHKAGLPFRVSPHMLRSTAITHALDQGASHRGVQQMAGWTSPLMISRYDKKRMDPKYSAIHQLRYGKILNPSAIDNKVT